MSIRSAEKRPAASVTSVLGQAVNGVTGRVVKNVTGQAVKSVTGKTEKSVPGKAVKSVSGEAKSVTGNGGEFLQFSTVVRTNRIDRVLACRPYIVAPIKLSFVSAIASILSEFAEKRSSRSVKMGTKAIIERIGSE